MRKDKAIKFLKQAIFVANNFSKDNSTKVGALIIDGEDFSVLTQGYNGMPRGADETIPERWERPTKYLYFEHGERNAVYNLARRNLKGCTAVTTEVPSMDCMRALISVGCKRLYMPQPAGNEENIDRATGFFLECGGALFYTQSGFILGEDSAHQPFEHQAVEQAAMRASLYAPKQATKLIVAEQVVARGSTILNDDGSASISSVRDAIYTSVRPDLVGAVGLVTACSCIDCAKCWAAVGLSRSIYLESPADLQERWNISFTDALNYLENAGVKTNMIKPDELAFPEQFAGVMLDTPVYDPGVVEEPTVERPNVRDIPVLSAETQAMLKALDSPQFTVEALQARRDPDQP